MKLNLQVDDDKTPYVASDKVDGFIKILENNSFGLLKWFSDKQMRANKDKWNLIFSNNVPVSIKIDDTEVEISEWEKVLGMKIDPKLNFRDHLGLSKKPSWRVNVLPRITPYKNVAKQRLLMNSFLHHSSTTVL